MVILAGPYFTGIGKVISGSVGVTSGDVEDVDFAWLLFKSLV